MRYLHGSSAVTDDPLDMVELKKRHFNGTGFKHPNWVSPTKSTNFALHCYISRLEPYERCIQACATAYDSSIAGETVLGCAIESPQDIYLRLFSSPQSNIFSSRMP